MKATFVENLRCPFCRSSGLMLRAREEDDREIREGDVTCGECNRRFVIRRGILNTIDPENDVVAREIHGWNELAGPLGEGLVSTMVALPYYPHEPWPHVGPDFFQIFEHVSFEGMKVIDIGAGRAWSSRFLGTVGRAAQVVAVDVLTTRFLGLETSDIYFAEDQSYFERICGDVHNLPIRDGWADVVFSCATVHHSGNLEELSREVWRVLRPGGSFVLVCEPCKKASISVNVPTNDETAHGINEHIYSYDEYVAPLRKLGFRIQRLAPRSLRYRMIYRDPDLLTRIPAWMLKLGKTGTGRALIQGAIPVPVIGPMLYKYVSLPLSIVATRT